MQRNPSSVYRINASLKNSLVNEEIDGLPFPKSYMDINKFDDFHDYLTNLFAPAIQEMSITNNNAMNKIIGDTIRIRQLRVRPNSCPDYGFNLTCYSGQYNHNTKDREPYGPNGIYTYTSDAGGSYVFGYSQYVWDRSGYFLDIPVSNISESIKTLFDDNFFDVQTRAVIFSFVTLNLNYESRATVAYLLTEWSAAGGINAYSTLRTYRIEMYNNAIDRFRAFLEISFLLFVIYYLYYFLNEARIDYQLSRLKYYFSSFWNILEMINISLFLATVILYFIFLGDGNRKLVDTDFFRYPKFLEPLGQTALVYYQLSAINILLLSFKTFRFLIVHRRLYVLWITLSQAKLQLVTFTTMFIIMMIGFLMSGWLTFGSEMDSFNGFISSLGTLLQFIIGNPPDYSAMSYTNRALGPIKWQRYAMSVKLLFRKNTYEVYDLVHMFIENKPGVLEDPTINPERLRDELQSIGTGIRFDESIYYADLLMKVHRSRNKYLREITSNKNTGGVNIRIKISW
eukprot:gene992-1258_t